MSNEKKDENIFVKIPKIMAEIKEVGKNKSGEGIPYMFRGIEDLYNTLKPIMASHGVFCVTQVIDSTYEKFERTNKFGTIQINFRTIHKVNHKFYSSDGSFVEIITCGEGIDNSDKSSNKALSSAMKYAFIQTFSIPTEDINDPDSEKIEIEVEKKEAVKNKVVNAVESKSALKQTNKQQKQESVESFDDFLL